MGYALFVTKSVPATDAPGSGPDAPESSAPSRSSSRRWVVVRFGLVAALLGHLVAWGLSTTLLAVASISGGGAFYGPLPELMVAAIIWGIACIGAVAVGRALSWSLMVIWVPWQTAMVLCFFLASWFDSGLMLLYGQPILMVTLTVVAAWPAMSRLRRAEQTHG